MSHATATNSEEVRPRTRGRGRRYLDGSQTLYQSLLNRIQAQGFGPGGQKRTLGITSCLAGEGVTTITSNLAIHAAMHDGWRTIVVDANLSRPKQHKIFDLSDSPGIRAAARNRGVIEQCVQTTTFSNLYVFPAETEQAGRGDVVPVDQWEGLMQYLSPEFDLVVVDVPAITAPTNVTGMLGGLDGVLVVLEAERISDEAAQRELHMLQEAGANLLGIVFNKYRSPLPKWLDRKQ